MGDVRWDARDFRLNELAWQFWPRTRQLSRRIEILTRLSEVAARNGFHVYLTDRPGVAAFLLGRLTDASVDAVELRSTNRGAPAPAETGHIMQNAGFRLVEMNATGSYFEQSLRLVRIAERNQTRTRLGAGRKRRVIESSDRAHAVYAAVSVDDLQKFLTEQFLEGVCYVKDRLSGRRIAGFLRRQGIVCGAAFLKALALDSYARRFANRGEKVSLDRFLSFSLLDDSELNALVRRPHFNLITDNGRLRTIGEIVEFMKHDENMATILRNARDPVSVKLSPYPRHLDRSFWENGNAFFFNCVLSGFRCDVRSYEQIDSMLDERGGVLYSRQYYSRLPAMSDVVIAQLLREKPIEVTNGAVSSGRHRVCAMIGHLIAGRQYLPFWALTA
jgi:hypothetical protein